jgi:cephalosporin hydroxylase
VIKAKSGALQDPAELIEFLRIVQRENVRSYLEIGSKFGGSLWAVTIAMQAHSRAVSVDLEGRAELKECVHKLQKIHRYEVHMVTGDSSDPNIIETVRVFGPYDLLLIDGNHTEPFVRMDWLNYGPMARIVAFHDIAYDLGDRPDKPWKIEVPKVWNEIKQGFRHEEIKLCRTKRDNGIGILWR